jgi:Protein of unknown function (DUF1018)
MSAVRKPTGANTMHLAAIHVVRGALAKAGVMTDADYRSLAVTVTGLDSSAKMSVQQRSRFLAHLRTLEVKHLGVQHVAGGKPRAKASRTLEPLEKKVWALWYALETAGRVNFSPNGQARVKALRAYVTRQTGATDMAFCTGEQLNKLVEAMKKWLERGKDEAMDKATEVAR